MNSYELTVILRNKDLDALKGKLSNILAKHSISIVKDEPWGMRKLSYMVDGENEGYYSFMIVESPPDSVRKVISEFRLNSDILRYLFVKMDMRKAS